MQGEENDREMVVHGEKKSIKVKDNEDLLVSGSAQDCLKSFMLYFNTFYSLPVLLETSSMDSLIGISSMW